jgi:hypothetical protein
LADIISVREVEASCTYDCQIDGDANIAATEDLLEDSSAVLERHVHHDRESASSKAQLGLVLDGRD